MVPTILPGNSSCDSSEPSMRRLVLIPLFSWLAIMSPVALHAQATTQPPAAPPPTAPAASSTSSESSGSLFDLTPNQFIIGGRATSIDGDPARFQRYQDVRDGLLFSGFRYSFVPPDEAYSFHARANNVGWRDQEYFGDYDRA